MLKYDINIYIKKTHGIKISSHNHCKHRRIIKLPELLYWVLMGKVLDVLTHITFPIPIVPFFLFTSAPVKQCQWLTLYIGTFTKDGLLFTCQVVRTCFRTQFQSCFNVGTLWPSLPAELWRRRSGCVGMEARTDRYEYGCTNMVAGIHVEQCRYH